MVGVLVACALGLGASAALGLLLTPTIHPLPGSNFQGGDGNQANDHGHIDWQELQADGLVFHKADLGPSPNFGCDDHFTHGSKELSPGAWSLTCGTLGAGGADILDTYHAFEHPAGGNAFLYLAMVRRAATGTWFLTFELNQNVGPNPDGTWFNGISNVPCRTTGDLLITFQQHGNETSVWVQEWIDRTVDSATGCARTGTLENVDPADGLTTAYVQGSFNEHPIHNYLPGCGHKLPSGNEGCFEPGGTIPLHHFMEAAINLTKVLHIENEPCVESRYISIWAHSRASTGGDPSTNPSQDSDMKDFVAPQSVLVQDCKDSPTLTTEQGAEIGGAKTQPATSVHVGTAIFDTATISGAAAATGTLTFHLYGPDNPTCSATPGPVFTSSVPVEGASGPHNSASFTPTTTGTYRWTVTYSGDANNHAFGPTACTAEPVDVTEPPEPPPPTPPPTPAQPSLTTSASPSTAPYGSAVGDTATLTGGYNPTGTIEFRLYGPDDASCAGPPAFVVHQLVHGNGSWPSPTPAPTLAGTYRWVAVYSGDDHNASVSTSCGEAGETVVVQAPPTIHPAPEEREPSKPKPKPKPKPPPPKFTG